MWQLPYMEYTESRRVCVMSGCCTIWALSRWVEKPDDTGSPTVSRLVTAKQRHQSCTFPGMWTRDSLTKNRVNNPRLRFIVNIETELTPGLTTVIKYPLTAVLLGSIPIVLSILASILQQQYNQSACATVRTVHSYFLAHFTYNLKYQDSNITTIVRYEILMMGEFIRLSVLATCCRQLGG